MSAVQPPRLQLGEVPVDRVTFEGALDAIAALVEGGHGGTVLTPNVDHVVLAGEDDRFRGAYSKADLSLADGMPVVWAAAAMGEPVPEKISGSDLTVPLMALAAQRGWRVFLLGGADGVAARAAQNLIAQFPTLKVVGTASPRIPAGDPHARKAAPVETSPAAAAPNAGDPPLRNRRAGEHVRREVVESIKASRPDIVLVGLGAPKQELWIHEAAAELAPAVLLGVGASIDFVAGTAKRAPAWMSRVGLEWSYRLAQEPRRMWRRYLVRDPKFLRIVLADLVARVRQRKLTTKTTP